MVERYIELARAVVSRTKTIVTSVIGIVNEFAGLIQLAIAEIRKLIPNDLGKKRRKRRGDDRVADSPRGGVQVSGTPVEGQPAEREPDSAGDVPDAVHKDRETA